MATIQGKRVKKRDRQVILGDEFSFDQPITEGHHTVRDLTTSSGTHFSGKSSADFYEMATFASRKNPAGIGSPQLPHKADWPISFVRHVVRRPEKRVRHRPAVLLLPRPDKQQDVAASLSVMDVALPGWRRLRSAGLRLPVEQRRRDRVVLVERGRRVVALGLLQRHEEQVAVRVARRGTPLSACRASCPMSSMPNAVRTSSQGVARVHGERDAVRPPQLLIQRIGDVVREVIQQRQAVRQVPRDRPGEREAAPVTPSSESTSSLSSPQAEMKSHQ